MITTPPADRDGSEERGARRNRGGHFKVVFDTHTVELGLDPATAVMTVNGTQAGGAAWDGSGPGGHHREGTLRFTTPVPSGAAVELRITGLPQDATGTWTAP